MADTHRMVNPRKILVKDLNDNLTCSLCGGYLVDATSVIDCSHTFCRACIVRHFESSRFCPNCGSLVHKSKPLSKLRSDTTLQTLIYKVVPSLYSKELQRRADFYHSTGFRANSSCSDDSILGDRTQDSEEWVLSNIGDPSLYFSPDDSISLSVEYYRNEQEEDNDSETKCAIKNENDIVTDSSVQIDVKTDNISCETVKLETNLTKINDKPSTVVDNCSGNVANGSCSTVSPSSNVANTSTSIVNALNNITNTSCNVVNTSCNVANTSCNITNPSCNVANTSCNIANPSCNVNTSCNVANSSCNVNTSYNNANPSCNVANTSCSLASTSSNLASASDGIATDSAVLANGSVNVNSNAQTVTNCSAILEPESNNDNGSGDCGNFANPTVEDVKNIGHKRFLRCPAAVRMNHLMKFLRMKFALSNEHRVDIIYSGEVLPPYLSLMDVAYTFKWNRELPMRFFYLIHIPVARPVLPQQVAIVPPTTATTAVMKVELIAETDIESNVRKLKDTKSKDIIKSETEDKKDNNNIKPVQKSVKFFDEKPTNSESKATQKSVKFVENNFKSLNNYGMMQKSFDYKVKSNDVEQSSSTENCVYDYTEPDKDEIKAFAERRDREWALQKHVEPEIHVSKKRKKNKHSKNETYKKHKLHAEITSNEISSKPDDSLKLKVKLSLANGHKHKHRSNSSSSSSSIAIVEPIKTHELSPKEKLLQMRQVRHKNITPPVLDDKFKHVTAETSSYKIVPSTEKVAEKSEVITEKAEPVMKRPEPPPKRLEPVMKKSEPIMKKPEQIMKKPEQIMKKPEQIMKKPEQIMKKPEQIMKKPEPITKKPEASMKKAELITKKPEPLMKKPEPIMKKPEPNMKRPESVPKKSDVPVRKPESITSVTERVPKTPDRVMKAPERAADILSTGKTLRSDFSFKTSMSKDICNKYVRVNLEKCTDNKMLSQKKNIVGNNLTIRNVEKNETVSNADKNRLVESKTEIIAIENKTTDNKLSDNKSTDKLPITKVPDNKQDSKKNSTNLTVTETKKEQQNIDLRNTDVKNNTKNVDNKSTCKIVEQPIDESKTIENKLNNIDFKTSQSSTLVTKNFTVSKVETGVKRPLENPDMSAEKRPSLEITVINLVSRPPQTSSSQTNSVQTKPASNTQTKHTISMTNDGPPAKKIRPPPLTIPLTRIQKMNIKTNMPKPAEKCDTFGPLDLSAKPNKIDIKPNEVRSNSVSPKPKIQDGIQNLIRPRTPIKSGAEFMKLECGKSTDKAQFSDKRPNISNLQLLSESATQIRELMMLKNPPTTLPVPNLIKKTPTNSAQNAAFKSPDFLAKNPNFLPKTPCLIPKNPAAMNKSPNFLPKGTNFLPKNLQKLPKLNEINKGQFSRLNAAQQLRSPRPAGQNQSIRNIPNPSLLVRQNRINSLNNTSTNLSSPNSVTNKSDGNVEMSSAKMNTVKLNLTETVDAEKKPETKPSEPPPLKPIETYKK